MRIQVFLQSKKPLQDAFENIAGAQSDKHGKFASAIVPPRHHGTTVSVRCWSNLPLVSLAARGTRWTTAQSPCPSDTQTASSQTATAATESKWQSRSTWQRSLGKGIDRELETKDAGWHICSILPSPSEKQQKSACSPT